MADKTLLVLVKGRVQGVFFRAFVKEQANRLGVKGYVRNRSDGRVEAVCCGNEKALKELLKQINKGPVLSRVEKVEAKQILLTPLADSFEVLG